MRLLGLISTLFLISACATSLNFLDQSRQPDFALHVDKAEIKKLALRHGDAPDNLHFALVYARALYGGGDYRQALSVIRPFTDHEDLELWDQLFFAKLYQQNKQSDDAKQLLLHILETNSNALKARMLLAELYENDKEWALAEDQYLIVLDHDGLSDLPDDEDIQVRLAHVFNLISQERFIEAGNRMLTTKTLYPQDRSVERNLRIVLAMLQSNGHSAPKPMPRPHRE